MWQRVIGGAAILWCGLCGAGGGGFSVVGSGYLSIFPVKRETVNCYYSKSIFDM